MFRIIGIDKKDMAGLDLLCIMVSLNDNGMPIEFFSGNRFIDITAKRIITQNTDDKWRIGAAESRQRPVNKLGKVVKKYRFDLIFLRCNGLRMCCLYAQEQA